MIIFQWLFSKIRNEKLSDKVVGAHEQSGETLWSEERCAFFIFYFYFWRTTFPCAPSARSAHAPQKKVTRRDLNISNNSEKVACRCVPSLYQCSLLLLLHPSSSLAQQSPLVLYRTTLMSLSLLSVYPSHSHSHPELELLFDSPTPTFDYWTFGVWCVHDSYRRRDWPGHRD
jgi:hypothetical protein